MLDVLELEKKWSKYHFKKLFPLYIASFILVIIVGVSSYLYIMNPEVILALIKDEKTLEKSPTVVEVNKSIEPVIAIQVKKDDEQNVLVPSFNFIYNLEDQVINYNNANKLASVTTPDVTMKRQVAKAPKPKKQKKSAVVPKKVKKAPTKAQKKVAKPVAKKVTKQEPSPTVIIGSKDSFAYNQEPQNTLVQIGDKSTTEDELRGVIKRFNRNKNPALSLFIAKKYYEKGNYNESYTYARETYILNPNIEDGVLLYSQSLVKLGKNKLAISKLEPYIKKSGSIKAKTLLNEIQKGNFK